MRNGEPVRYRARVAYLGTFFRGWQVQKNADRTVQAVLEAALFRVEGGPVRAVAAGRTDTGVHADGQVVHFDLSGARDPGSLVPAINASLPWDLRVLRVDRATPDFHARRDAAWKDYLYRWNREPVVPPTLALFTAPLSPRADASRMRAAAEGLAGERDFGVFGVRSSGQGGSTVRRLHFVRISERGGELRALFRGDAFLRGMVRSMCGVLADVSRGRVPPGRVDELLRTGDRRLLSQKAPAHGLTLLRVSYRDGS